MERCWSSDPDSRLPFSEIAKELRDMSAAMNIKDKETRRQFPGGVGGGGRCTETANLDLEFILPCHARF
ncbi:hypothetical protein F0562_006432 [Nyssa sinensis]|uniref:Serine-threonine/tyrosine-protein kinase catalytic domain-containing protein n=1 Tax=Nyssa sinensis TaxID=561372 RepID=A0A5J5AS33_9ASTE|nr:hypothetical protein F0562_006432 [Nyssa sinensis]